ncbi:hypothetical protein ACVWZZ_002463 [Bradyrhizobium sp. LM6.10]
MVAGRRGDVNAHLELARRFGRALGFELRDLAIDLALFPRGISDRGVGGRDLLTDRAKRRPPFGDRARFALFTEPGGGRFGKPLREFAPRNRRIDCSLQIGALVLERFDALVEFGQVDRRRRTRRPRIDRADGEFCARLAFDAEGGRIERERKIPGDQRAVAGGNVQRDDTGDGGAIGIDGDGVDRRCGVDVCGP